MKPHDPDEALPGRWTDALLQSVAPVPLAPERRAAIKERLMRSIAGAEPFVSLRRDEGWLRLHDKAEVKLLAEDAHSFSWLLRMAPGARLPAHGHDSGDEECMVIEGSLLLNGERYGAGDFQLARAGTRHHEVVTDSGCLIYLRSPLDRKAELLAACQPA
jgi:quercetin dioxygenase-like cupin family protein